MDCPRRIDPESLADYLEMMSQTVFWVGISWRVVDSKWPDIREAFRGFDPVTVANLSPDEIDGLASDKRVIRHRGELEAIVQNAGRILQLEDSEMSAHQFLYSVSAFGDDGAIRRD